MGTDGGMEGAQTRQEPLGPRSRRANALIAFSRPSMAGTGRTECAGAGGAWLRTGVALRSDSPAESSRRSRPGEACTPIDPA